MDVLQAENVKLKPQIRVIQTIGYNLLAQNHTVTWWQYLRVTLFVFFIVSTVSIILVLMAMWIWTDKEILSRFQKKSIMNKEAEMYAHL